MARFGERSPSFAKATEGKTGSSIVVVRMLWEHIVRVRFSAPRPVETSQVFENFDFFSIFDSVFLIVRYQ